MRLVVLADDLTGALDTAVKFRAQGVAAEVYQGLPACLARETNPAVMVVNLGLRHLPPNDARQAVTTALEALRGQQVYFYLKTDSGLRGNIGASLDAMAQTLDCAVTFVPAYPAAGRVTIGGIHYVDGVPVSQSVFGRDLHNPVGQDAVADILREQTTLPVRPFPVGGLAAIEVCDASTETDMAAIAEALSGRHLCPPLAGCAGFAAYLPALLGLPTDARTDRPALRHMLVVSGSTSAISLEQLRRARLAGIPSLRLSDPFGQAPLDSAVIETLMDRLGRGSMLLETAYTPEEVEAVTQAGLTAGLSMAQLGERIARRLAEVVATAVSAGYPGALCVFGGDTLQCVLETLAARRVEPLLEPETGVVVSRLTHAGGEHVLISKSGSLGSPDALLSILNGEGDTWLA